jgi:hypothetical protein
VAGRRSARKDGQVSFRVKKRKTISHQAPQPVGKRHLKVVARSAAAQTDPELLFFGVWRSSFQNTMRGNQPLNNVQNNPASSRMSLVGPKPGGAGAAGGAAAGAGGRKSLAGRQSLAPTSSRFVRSVEADFFVLCLFSNSLASQQLLLTVRSLACIGLSTRKA